VIELITVIGIIGILCALLLPSAMKARESARSLQCLMRLRTLGQAFQMYAAEQRGYLPYPTTKLYPPPTDQRFLWFNAVDPYLRANVAVQSKRRGVAATRNYRDYKQCYVWDTFDGPVGRPGDQTTKESARTYKMNAHLRRHDPPGHARITDVRQSSNFVLLGDGTSLDATGPVVSQWESQQFSMEVNDATEANPALRHQRAANILFVDGHAAAVQLPTIAKNLRDPEDFVSVKSWESEYVDAKGQPATPDPQRSLEAQGLRRNPRMPLIWSDPPKLYRP